MGQSVLAWQLHKIICRKMGNKSGTPVLRQEDIGVLITTSGMDETQVRECFDNFVEEHPNGKMKKKDFRDMMEKALPNEDAKKMEKHMFRIYDTNDDGTVDFVEFMLVFHIMSDGSPEEVLARIFRVFDVNSDGSVSKKELERLIRDMYGLINEENPSQASQEFIAKSAFSEMDQDNDEKVTLEE